MGFVRVVSATSLALTCGMVVAPAGAAEGDDFAAALGLQPGSVAVTASGSVVVQNTRFNDFPSGADDAYLALSTGDATQVFPPRENLDPDAQLSTDVDLDGLPDASVVTLQVEPEAGVGCLFVDFAMGTEEPVHTYEAVSPSDTLSITRAATPDEEYAMNAGPRYFSQTGSPAAPVPYEVNALKYWHQPGDTLDPVTGSAEVPRLERLTGLNHVTTRDTARVPLTFAGGAETVTIRIDDANNGDLDSVAFVDDVRFGPTCEAGTGVEPLPANEGGMIGGIRGVGNELWYDPVPSTSDIERYDDPAVQGNGWRSPSNVPVELRFRWYSATPGNARNGDMSRWRPIDDADRQSYVPQADDRGRSLIVLVTGVVDGRRYETFPSTGTADSWYSTLPIDFGTFQQGEAPQIAGPSDRAARVGDTLTASTVNTVPLQDTYGFQWYADGNTISGETGKTITLGASQAGKLITVRATAKRLNFDDKTWTSASYGPVQYDTWNSVGTPTIVHDGSPEAGDIVVADPGTGWSPTPTSYTYQWKRDGAVIPGARNADYAVTTADVGAELSVVVSGVRTGFALTQQESSRVAVLGATMVGAVPTISGEARVGERLTGTVLDWTPSGSRLNYAWYAGGALLQSGTSRYLTVPPAAAGKSIVLEVTGTKSGYSPATRASEPTGAVAAGELRVGRVRISGSETVGSRLTAIPGSWAPSGVRLSYRWKVGKKWVAGKRGRSSSFKLSKATRGKRVTVRVTGSLPGYRTATGSDVTDMITRR